MRSSILFFLNLQTIKALLWIWSHRHTICSSRHCSNVHVLVASMKKKMKCFILCIPDMVCHKVCFLILQWYNWNFSFVVFQIWRGTRQTRNGYHFAPESESCLCCLVMYYPLKPALPLQTVQIQITWLLQKPSDLDLHSLPLSMWICINNLDQTMWLAEN